MALRALGFEPARVGEAAVSHASFEQRRLNSGQQEAIRRAVGGDLGLILGPPGTGKTTTGGCLAAVLADTLGERLLVTAHTNAALDTLLASILASLPPEWPNEGKVLREGRLSKEFRHLGIDRTELLARSARELDLRFGSQVQELEREAEIYLRDDSPVRWIPRRARAKQPADPVPVRVTALLTKLTAVAARRPGSRRLAEILTQVRAVAEELAAVGEAACAGARAARGGVARTLAYRAPEAGEVRIFDHTSR